MPDPCRIQDPKVCLGTAMEDDVACAYCLRARAREEWRAKVITFDEFAAVMEYTGEGMRR